MRSSTKGSITVFLTLTFLIIFSLIAVTLEAAASSAARATAKLSLFAACESVLGGYYGPLFDDYGIFALNLGDETGRFDEEALQDQIAATIGESSGKPRLSYLRAIEFNPLVTAQGENFIKAAVSDSDQNAVEGLIDGLLKYSGILKQAQSTDELYRKQVEIEKKFEPFDEKKLLLMKLIDGINLTGLKYGVNSADAETSFVKQFMIRPVDQSNTGVNNAYLFSRVSGAYVNPLLLSEKMENLRNRYIAEKREQGDISARIAHETEAMARAGEELDALTHAPQTVKNAGSESAKEKEAAFKEQEKTEKRRKELTEEIERSEELIPELQKRSNVLEMEQKETEEEFQTVKLRVQELCEAVKSCAQEAISVINEILELQISVRPEIAEFEALITECLQSGETEFTTAFTEKLEVLREYAGMSDGAGALNYTAMLDSLSRDVEVTNNLSAFIDGRKITDYNREQSDAIMSGFTYEALSFDYSSYKEETWIVKGFVEGIVNAASQKLLELFLPSGVQISDLSIDTELLPSSSEGLHISEEEEKEFKLQDLLEPGENGSGLAWFSGLSIEKLLSIAKDIAGKLGDKAALLYYTYNHFKCFTDNKTHGDTALEYETEYLLGGKDSDTANFSLSVYKVFLIRLLGAAAYIFTNSSTTTQAAGAAGAIIGFTGVPILVSLLKYTILLVWAVEQATIETAALLRGQRIGFITTESNLCISLEELPFFGRELINTKANAFPAEEKGVNYQTCLMLMLLFKSNEELALRAEDIIQENVRYRYEDSFLIANCVTGFEAEAKFAVPVTFLKLAGNRGKGRLIKGYTINTRYRADYY